MKEFEGRTAVVTGAASGIGRALAERFAAAGMNVVLADVEAGPVRELAHELAGSGTAALAVPTDVSARESVEALAAAATDRFGKVHVLCNNAGVAAFARRVHEQRMSDWQWLLGVNLWGVIHGVRAFVPGMLAHGEQGHIVNTSSGAGLFARPFQAPYEVSKAAVVALSESLYQELYLAGDRIGVSVLCPGAVSTKIFTSGRNRPGALGGAADSAVESTEDVLRQVAAMMLPDGVRPDDSPAELTERAERAFHDSAIPADAVAAMVERAIRDRQFWVLTHPELGSVVAGRAEEIRQQTTTAVPDRGAN